jgi:hypothetical protein
LAQTVDGMLPDFRFALGGILAMTVLGVAGLGIVMSVRLVHEARDGSFDASRSLAFADTGGDRNPFYDPPPRPFPAAEDAIDEPAADVTAPPAVPTSSEDAAASPDTASGTAASPTAVALADPTDQTAPAPSPTVAKDAVEAPARLEPIDAGEVSAERTQAGAAAAPTTAEPPPAAEPDRVASVSATAPASEPGQDEDALAGHPLTGVVPLPPKPPMPPKPVVHVRPLHRRLGVHRVAAHTTTTTDQQPFSNQGYWTDSGQYQPYPGQPSSTTTTRTHTRVSGNQTAGAPARR